MDFHFFAPKLTCFSFLKEFLIILYVKERYREPGSALPFPDSLYKYSNQNWTKVKPGLTESNLCLLYVWWGHQCLSQPLPPPWVCISRKVELHTEPGLQLRHSNMGYRHPVCIIIVAPNTHCYIFNFTFFLPTFWITLALLWREYKYLPSFIIIMLRYIHVGMWIETLSSLLLNSTPLYGHTTVCFSTHFWMDIWIVSSWWPSQTQPWWASVLRFLPECSRSFLLSK